MIPTPQAETADPRWNGLYKVGGAAAWTTLAIMIAQIGVFIAWPPPETVESFFKLFRENWLLGLLSLDLLYILNNAVIIPIYLALYVTLKREAESAMLIALVVGLVGIGAYFASSVAFEMLSLSQAAAAANDAQRSIFQAAGEAMLATYKGTAFDVYYVLNAFTLLVFSTVMLRSKIFSKATAYWGLAAGVLMIIPSTAGTIGLIFSLLSLIPWAVFAAKVAIKFTRLGAAAS